VDKLSSQLLLAIQHASAKRSLQARRVLLSRIESHSNNQQCVCLSKSYGCKERVLRKQQSLHRHGYRIGSRGNSGKCGGE
jgi:hypothetical protein